MASGIAKLKLIMEIQNKLKSGLDSAKDQISKATGNLQSKLKNFSAQNTKMFDAIKEEVPGAERAIGMLTNPYILAAAAAVAFGAAVYKSVVMANEWHTQMAKINTTAGLGKVELKGLSDKLLEIGGNNIAPLEEVPQAFNRIISAGLSVNDSLATLEPTLRAAKAGFTDIETVASAAVSVMQSSGESANKVYDVLFATLNKGNAEFKDIAQYLPKIIPLARNVGFALDETAGAFASLTTKLSAEQSTTALQGIMRSLSNKDIVKNFKGLGIDVFDVKTGKVKPILDIITQLNSQMTGLTDKERMLKFGKLGLDQESALGFSTLMQDIPGLKSAIDATVNSQGALNKAYADSKTPMDSWLLVQNKLKVQAIKFGEKFLPILSSVGEAVAAVIDIINGTGSATDKWHEELKPIVNIFKMLYKLVTLPSKIILDIITATIEWASKSEIVQDIAGGISKAFSLAWEAISWIGDQIKWLWDNTLGPLFSKIEDAYTGIKGLLGIESEKKPIKYVNPNDISDAQIDQVSKKFGFNSKTIKSNRDYIEKERKRTGLWSDPRFDKANGDGEFGDGTGDGSSGTGKDAKTISSGSQTKNVTVNIDSFIKEFKPTNQSINSLSRDELEKWLQEMFMRVVRSAELTM